MTYWSTISDDDLIEEAQRRANAGNWSPDRFMSQLQSDDRGKLDILRSAIIQAKVEANRNGDCPAFLTALAVTCDQLDSVRGNPLPDRAWAVNTTFVGRSAFEDHAPRAA
ncbi:hypothetical protein EPK99_06510 [Neorhizobium lilium]|uniref:Uncharacterized protein n=1 Tax=Neorhizobium lilium TaxID=2503024 RepID=A0A3S3SZB3_9HYPH|nr:hypothetical protein [Neorhizobium lilium]RWX78280.1 hypothetical protein EPK99_06510 [Neorhizobium lilium]